MAEGSGNALGFFLEALSRYVGQQNQTVNAVDLGPELYH